MGNEQSTSGGDPVHGHDDGERENKTSRVRQQLACVSNGDENNFMPIVGHSLAPGLPAINNTTSTDDRHKTGYKTYYSTASHAASCSSSRTSSISRSYKAPSKYPPGHSPFATRSLRIHNPRLPTRYSNAMDNIGESSSPSPRPSSSVHSTSSTSRSPKPTSICRQRSAVTFSSSSSGAFSLSAVDTSTGKCPPLATLLGLSAYQQNQIVQSWPKIQQSGGHTAGAEIFRKLTLKSGPIKETFQKADVVERLAPRSRGFDIYKDHGRLLFEVFQTAVNALTDPADGVIDMCRGYGAKHLSLRGEGFQTRMWDDLSESLVEHITRLDAVRRHREVIRAWTVLIMFLVDKMKEGYDTGLRKCSSPVICSPYTHRAFTVEDQTETSRNRSETDSDHPKVTHQFSGRRGDRSTGSLRKVDPVEQQRDLEEDMEKEMRRMSRSDV